MQHRRLFTKFRKFMQ